MPAATRPPARRRRRAGAGRDAQPHAPEDLGYEPDLAKYDDRYTIPKAHREVADNLQARQGGCGLDFAGGPGSCGADADPVEGEAGIDLGQLAITRHRDGA